MTSTGGHHRLQAAALEQPLLGAIPKNVIAPPTRSTPIPSPSTTSPTWNTEDLAWRLSSDAAAASCAAGLVAPVITIIDRQVNSHQIARRKYTDSRRSIIERASSRMSFRSSILNSTLQTLRRPHTFVTSKPFALIFALYFGTYWTANSVDSLNSTIHNKRPDATTAGPTKFVATSAANMSLCLYKDSQFTRMFGSSVPACASKVPGTSYALFAIRDSMTVLASFNLPPLLAPLLPMSQEVERHVSRVNAAQFVAPAAMQLLSTPLHLWGLDLYNRPSGNGVDWKARFQRVTRDWLGSSVARMCRIIPAFGVGGVVNTRVRARMMGSLS